VLPRSLVLPGVRLKTFEKRGLKDNFAARRFCPLLSSAPDLVERRAPTEARSEVGQRIVEARHDVGLTQTELARQIGLPLYLVEKLENGEADASSYLEAISAVTRRPVSWLSGASEPTVAHTQSAVERLQGELAELRQNLSHRLDELEEWARDQDSRRGARADAIVRVEALAAELADIKRRLLELEARLTRRRSFLFR
jgi:transcriptional regulator with XRE-family HTH domain